MHKDHMSTKQCKITDVQNIEAKPPGSTAAKPSAPPMSPVPMSRWIDSSVRDVIRACHSKLGAVPAIVPFIFVFICALAVFYGRWRKAKNKTKTSVQGRTHSVLPRSVSMAVLHGGKAVVERLMDAHEVRMNQKALEEFTADMEQLLRQHPIKFVQLNKTAAKLEMSGNEEKAIELLEKAMENAEKDTYEVYELQMLIVEMLIYKGEFQKALKYECLRDEEISDARIPLYKAIIYTITGKKDEAKKFYEEFQEIRSCLHPPEIVKEGSQLFLAMHEHEQFEKLVENLRKEIEHVRSQKSAK